MTDKPVTETVATTAPAEKSRPVTKAAVRKKPVQAAPKVPPVTRSARVEVQPAAPADNTVAGRARTVKAPAESKTEKKTVKAESDSREKPKKAKLVRDSFTMPEGEYAVLGEVKKACLKAGMEVKKSELLRVGVMLLKQLDAARLKEILADLPTLKAGRPKKSK